MIGRNSSGISSNSSTQRRHARRSRPQAVPTWQISLHSETGSHVFKGLPPPEAELREQFAAGPGGEVASQKAPQWVSDKVIAGQKKYAGITRPVLAIFAVQDKARADLPDDDDSRRAVAAYVNIATARAERRADALKHDMPSAKIVFIEQAAHHVFLSNEAQVLAAIRPFARKLPTQ